MTGPNGYGPSRTQQAHSLTRIITASRLRCYRKSSPTYANLLGTDRQRPTSDQLAVRSPATDFLAPGKIARRSPRWLAGCRESTRPLRKSWELLATGAFYLYAGKDSYCPTVHRGVFGWTRGSGAALTEGRDCQLDMQPFSFVQECRPFTPPECGNGPLVCYRLVPEDGFSGSGRCREALDGGTSQRKVVGDSPAYCAE